MKQLIAFLTIAAFVMACKKESSSPTPPPTSNAPYGSWVGRVSKSFIKVTKTSVDSISDALSMTLKEKLSITQPDSALLSYWSYSRLKSSTV